MSNSLNNVSHKLRNHVGVIHGAASLLESTTELTTEQVEYVNMINKAVAELLKLTEQRLIPQEPAGTDSTLAVTEAS